MPAFINAPDVYVLISEEMNGRLLAFPIINELRAAGLRVDYPLKEVAFGKQFKLAPRPQPRRRKTDAEENARKAAAAGKE